MFYPLNWLWDGWFYFMPPIALNMLFDSFAWNKSPSPLPYLPKYLNFSPLKSSPPGRLLWVPSLTQMPSIHVPLSPPMSPCFLLTHRATVKGHWHTGSVFCSTPNCQCLTNNGFILQSWWLHIMLHKCFLPKEIHLKNLPPHLSFSFLSEFGKLIICSSMWTQEYFYTEHWQC